MRKSNSATLARTASVMHIPNTLSLTSARNNRKQKFPIAFLFSKLHFNNVTEMLSFYSGHLLIRSSTPNFLIESFGYGVLHSRKTDYKYEAESERPTSKKETTTNGKRTK